MLIPSLKIQEQFDSFVNQIGKAKFSVQQSLSKLETLKEWKLRSTQADRQRLSRFNQLQRKAPLMIKNFF